MQIRSNRNVGMVVLGIAFLVFGVHAQTTTTAMKAGNQYGNRAVLVELFTSEGCSSCPPADALLREIDGKETAAGQQIIVISEHVTYWNHLGWSDPFSSDTYTERQSEYGRRFHLESVYTPQMVIDGEEQIVGSDRTALQNALSEEHAPEPLNIDIKKISRHGKGLTVEYSITGKMARSENADLFAVVADDTAKSSVAGGENLGRVLTHVSVARTMTRIGKFSTATDQLADVALPARDRGPQNEKRHLILFVQTVGQGRVLGATARPL